MGRSARCVAACIAVWIAVLMGVEAPAAAQEKIAEGSEQRIAELPLQRYHFFTAVIGLPSVDVSALYQDKYGFAWFGTFTGLSYWNGTQTVQVDLGAIKSITSISETENYLWIGTDSGLLALDRRRKPLEKPFLEEGILWISPKGPKQVWVGTPR